MKIKSLLAVGAVICAMAMSACTKMNSVEETTDKNAEAISELNEKINQLDTAAVAYENAIDEIFNLIKEDSIKISGLDSLYRSVDSTIISTRHYIDSIKLCNDSTIVNINAKIKELSDSISIIDERTSTIEKYIETVKDFIDNKSLSKDNFWNWFLGK